jgi:hypothetical protein
MKAKIILHIEGDEEAIKCVYFEITHGHSMEATYGEFKNHKLIETQAKVYKTELKEEKK